MTAHAIGRGFALAAVLTTLPVTAWELRPAGKDPLSGQTRCLLVEEPLTINDGYGETRIDILFNGEALIVVTDSEIDAGFNDLALSVAIERRPPARGQKIVEPPPSPRFVPARIENKKTLVFTDAPAIEEAFKAGSTASFALRFWPLWPSVGSIPVEVSLKGFTKVAEEFTRCTGQPAAGTTR
ncbi:hypothetical protein [Plasticicumulans sp.]|uniref:hypothetical protein n=1 Tax=Plasticicumulans sp. TaxID=2307179 RepID=UPI0039298AFC|nr:hypothetical protein [Pseudomonadota bacterium]